MLTRETVIVYGSWGKYEGELISFDEHGVTLGCYLAWWVNRWGEFTLHTIDSESTKIFWEDMKGLHHSERGISLLIEELLAA